MMWRKEAMRNRVGLSGRQPDQSRRRNTTIDPLVEERGDDGPRDMRRRHRLVARVADDYTKDDDRRRRMMVSPTSANDDDGNGGDDDASSSPAPDASRRVPDDSGPRCSPDSRKRVTISPGAETRDRHDTLVDGLGLRWLNGIST